MKQRQTLVVVAHESGFDDDDRQMPVEVYPYDPAEAVGAMAGQLLSAWRPAAGELSRGSQEARDRLDRVRSGMNPEITDDVASRGWYARMGRSDLAWCSDVAGDQQSVITGADYSGEHGRVFVVDADMDTETGEVDWTSVVTHPSADPREVRATVVRTDGVVVGPDSVHAGDQVVRDDAGVYQVIDQFGLHSRSYTDAERSVYEAQDRSGLRSAEPILVIVEAQKGRGPQALAVPLSDLRGGKVVIPSPGASADSFSIDGPTSRSLRGAAGPESEHSIHLSEHGDDVVRYGFVVEAPISYPTAGGYVFPDLMSAQPVSAEPPNGILPGSYALSLTESGQVEYLDQSAYVGAAHRPVSEAIWQRSSVITPGVVSSASPVHEQESQHQGVSVSEPVVGEQISDSVSRGSRVRGALSLATSKATEVAKDRGPDLVAAIKTKFADPKFRQQLRSATLTAIDIGLAGKGGGKMVKAAATASTAMRLADQVSAAKASADKSATGPSL